MPRINNGREGGGGGKMGVENDKFLIIFLYHYNMFLGL
jgi:hypothetical protein